MKRCRTCRDEKPLAQFYRETASRDGYRSVCKVCERVYRRMQYQQKRAASIAAVTAWQDANRERFLAYQSRYNERPSRKARDREGHLRRKFGITQGDYEAMLEAQGAGCAICGDPPPDGVSLHVDHDHDTGVVRGLLCIRCNNALGALRESDELLLRGAAYVGRDPELDGLARQRARALATLSS